MKTSFLNVRKQAGKVIAPVIIANGTTSALAKYRDNEYYQVKGHGDFVQDNGSR